MSFLNTISGTGPSNYQKTAWNQLNSIGQGAQDTGFGYINDSQQNFQAPTSYYSSILSGNPASVAGALSPEISQLQSAYQQNKQAVDQFAPQGGGRASFMAQLPFQRASAVTNLISGARQNAAQGLAGIAGTEGALGSSVLGVGTQAASAFGNQATTQNLADYLHSSGVGSAIAQMLLNALKGGNNPLGKILSKIPGLGGGGGAPSGGGGGGAGSGQVPAGDSGGNYPMPSSGGGTAATSSGVTGYYDPSTGTTYDANGNPVSVDPYGNGGYDPYYNATPDYSNLTVGPSSFDPNSINPPVSYDPYANLNSGNPADAYSNYYDPYAMYKG